MKSPSTAWPASFRSKAATAESTPPDTPTMTGSGRIRGAGAGEGGMRRLYRRATGDGAYGRDCAGRAEIAQRGLHQHLSHLRLLHAGLPDLVEEIQVATHHRGVVHVGDPVPAVGLQPVH